jgi:hypothetical protein
MVRVFKLNDRHTIQRSAVKLPTVFVVPAIDDTKRLGDSITKGGSALYAVGESVGF